MDEKMIIDRLDAIRLSQCGWEGREDIMTFNGKPIGMTISRNIEIDRWWPYLKKELTNIILSLLSDKEKRIEETEAERHRLSKLLIEARTRIVELKEGIKKLRDALSPHYFEVALRELYNLLKVK